MAAALATEASQRARRTRECAVGLYIIYVWVCGLQRPPSDLNFDAQLLVERVDVLVWYLHHEQVALAHLIMALLEGPHNEGECITVFCGVLVYGLPIEVYDVCKIYLVVPAPATRRTQVERVTFMERGRAGAI